MKIKVYGTMECPDTVEAVQQLTQSGADYEFIDVLASLANFKQFINLRDANPEVFEEAVKNEGIGIPAFVIDGEIVQLAVPQ